jgi:hypothetical protein
MTKATGKAVPAQRTAAAVGYLALTIVFAVFGVALFVVGDIGLMSDRAGFGFGLSAVVPIGVAMVTFNRYQAARTGRSPRLFPLP